MVSLDVEGGRILLSEGPAAATHVLPVAVLLEAARRAARPRRQAATAGTGAAVELERSVQAISRGGRQQRDVGRGAPSRDAAVAGGGSRRGARPDAGSAPLPTSSLSPRDIQARLRHGRSVEEVAAEAGVGPEWVERFAGPIRAEQRAAVSRAWGLLLVTPRRGTSTRPLGEAVGHHLAARGIRLAADELAACWSAYLRGLDELVVRFDFDHRRRSYRAEWAVHAASGTVTALDRLAAVLGFVAGADDSRPESETAGTTADPDPRADRPATPQRAPRKGRQPTRPVPEPAGVPVDEPAVAPPVDEPAVAPPAGEPAAQGVLLEADAVGGDSMGDEVGSAGAPPSERRVRRR